MHAEMADFPKDEHFYDLLKEQLIALSEESAPLSALCNAAALLYNAMQDINWAGFYIRMEDTLHLGPFQGKPACTQIPLGRGVCGTAARTQALQLVPDVALFPGHIACDSASRSEIVVPIVLNQSVWGVLDIDSPILSRFSEEDARGLQQFVDTLVQVVDLTRVY